MNNIAVYPPIIHILGQAKQIARIFIIFAVASFIYLLIVSRCRYAIKPKSTAPRSCSR